MNREQREAVGKYFQKVSRHFDNFYLFSHARNLKEFWVKEIIPISHPPPLQVKMTRIYTLIKIDK